VKVIIWILYITLSIYCLLDYFLSAALFKLGYDELNPFMLWMMGPNKNVLNILYFKIAMLSIAGFLIFIYTNKIKE